MNVKKKDNGDWILYPSKSIPGRFYYFNVRTGEAIWSLTETETNVVRNNKDIYKNYNYLQPVSPHKENAMTANIYTPANYIANESHQIQSFGQATFPKYISNVPNIVWAPIQLPMCMVDVPNVKKQTLDQNTQTSERGMSFVQRNADSFPKRFAPFDNIGTNSTPTDIRLPTSMPIKNWWNTDFSNSTMSRKPDESSDLLYKRKIYDIKVVSKETDFKRIDTLSDRHFKPQSGLFSKNLHSSLNFAQNTNLEAGYRDEYSMTTHKNYSMEKLQQSDLRVLLQMKKQKSLDVGVLCKRNQTQENSILKKTPKKKVSFNLDISNADSDDVVDTNKEKSVIPTPLKSLKESHKDMNKTWYVTVDEDVLLNDFNYIMDYINQDDSCKLLIPNSMVKYIESLGIGEHRGHGRVLAARQVYRRLLTSTQVQIVESEDGSLLMDDIINSCLQTMDEDVHVVLITGNVELEDIAKMYGINVYTLDDIKNDVTRSNPKDSIGVNAKDNLFLQNVDNFDPFVLSKSFNDPAKIKQGINDDINVVFNQNHSFDAKNHYNTIHLEINATDICLGIGKLKLNDKKLPDIRRTINNSLFIDNSDSTKIFKPITFGNNVKKGIFSKNNTEIGNAARKESTNDKNDDRLRLTNIFIETRYKDKSKCQFEGNQRANYLSKPKQTATNNTESKISNSTSIDNNVNYRKYFRPVISIGNNLADDGFKEAYVKDDVIKDNIISRYDEWICSYVQIMEELIHNVLQMNCSNESNLPCFLNEGLKMLKENFNNKDIKAIIEKILTLNRIYTTEGIAKKDLEPNDFMKILECGFLLVEGFKNLLSEDFSEIEELLLKLLNDIENPTCVEEFEQIETSIRRSDEDICTGRRNFVKKRSDIIQYLKTHFAEWKNYVNVDREPTEDVESKHVKIYRTSGRNLKTLKIDCQKRLSFAIPIKDKNSKSLDEDAINRGKTQNDVRSELDLPLLHGNTFGDDNQQNGPKVIRKIKLIEEFEEKVNKRTHLGLDDLEYSDITESLLSIRETDENYNETNNNDNVTHNDTYTNCDEDNMMQLNDCLSLINVKEHNNDAGNDSADSGSENEIPVFILIRSFFTELSVTFKMIYSFVVKCTNDLQEKELSDITKKKLFDKANQTHAHLAEIIDDLKSIIERESMDSTLRTLFIRAGSDVTEDKRLTRYRQTVIKCLEQARILESSLKMILHTLSDNCDMSISSEHDITHFNIFE